MRTGFSKFLAGIVVVSGVALTGPANAAAITGFFTMGGAGTLDAAIPSATAIDFGNNGSAAGTIIVTSSSGDFATFMTDFSTTGTIVDLADFSTTFAGFWTIGGFTFEITSFDTVTQTLLTGLDIVASGILAGNSFDPTPGLWELSGQSASGQPLTFSFSATTTGTGVPVPEPTTLGLIGFGLIGLGFAGRKRRKTA